ncbi:MAG: uroporphyrinogen decarboxylase [Deltaproteobacteria bacterium]|nr:uroporphyrinogen decarboxylase [Deltaproteobacteria bacterium]MDZ4224539.1 uroporphyrinogen decarboxylase [bacterium]
MFSQERFLKACRLSLSGRPPVWLMRQAGRALPEYRAIREKHGFMEMLSTPELIVEVSLQPWRRFKMDAVIVFSDILLIPWKMGMDLKFIEGQGPKFSKLIETEKDVESLQSITPEKDCPFLLTALRQLRKEIRNNAALLGFAGSPWTVASYMLSGVILSPELVEGRRISGSFADAQDDTVDTVKILLEKLTQQTIVYLKAQIEAGVDAVQIFDSWGGSLSAEEYAVWSAPYIKEVVAALKPTGVPTILYIKDSRHLLDQMVSTGVDVISVGWETPLELARKKRCAIQGNLDPHILMQATPDEVREKTQNMLNEMKNYPGYIANLGHGVLPKTPLENIAAFVETVKRCHCEEPQATKQSK